MGAWIETLGYGNFAKVVTVAPLVGAWIETKSYYLSPESIKVAPLVGAWIETFWETQIVLINSSRTPRGCVD